jgi:hypothetical protein
MVQALAFAELLAGGILFLCGWKGYSPAEVVKGEAGAAKPLGKGGAAAASSPSSSTPAGPLAGGEGSSSIPHTGSKFELKRKDAGRDVQLEPGATIGGPGSFRVLSILSDPMGFGPAYPVIELLSGRWKGHKLYLGHTDALLPAGPKVYPAGTPVARTSTTGHNAPPGWLELGFAESGTPGHQGQAVPF